MPIKTLIKNLLPNFLINIYYYLKAFFGAVFFGFPSKKVPFIGITGTKGKTTICYLIYRILIDAGFKTGLISSLYVSDGLKLYKSPYGLSMPTVFERDKLVKKMLYNKVDYVIQEVTSEGIKNKRHLFCNFFAAVISNLEPEHVEHHGSFENYKKAKLELFKIVSSKSLFSSFLVVNADDDNLRDFVLIKGKLKKIAVSLKTKTIPLPYDICLSPKELKLNKDQTTFYCQKTIFKLHLGGVFNVYNVLIAIAVAKELGIALKNIAASIQKIKSVPGRLEIIQSSKKNNTPTVIIDYAHTPRSFEAVFNTAVAYRQDAGKIIAVFGSAGGTRDKWKRPVIGKIAAKYADIIILTNEDPYEENPESIIEHIYKGISSTKKFKTNNIKVYKILDRSQAIKKALEGTSYLDVVLLLGKGSEETIHIKNGTIPWSDKKVALHYLSTISILH